MAYLKLSISVTCIGNNYYHDETKSHRCVVLLGDGSIELFEEGTLIKKMILFSDYNQELNKICFLCGHLEQNRKIIPSSQQSSTVFDDL
jgi:hypothetical protein